MPEELKEESLDYHRYPKPGKLEITPTKAMASQRDLAKAYSPGVAYACDLIREDPSEAANMTARGNLVAVISNGTAVLGLGNIGPLASKPVMEGKAVLFKKFANVDVFDIEINETDPLKLIEIVAALEPTFGGVNLEDIKAPECFVVEKALKERMNIPVFHDDQHGTAICAAAAVYNYLEITGKKIEEVTVVCSGAGAAAIACLDLVVSMGLKRENVYICDSRGVVYEGRTEGMNEYKAAYATPTDMRTLEQAIVGADIFFGLSGPDAMTGEDVKNMADRPLILAMANPVPEILPEVAHAARPDVIMATGRSDYPNQVNNVLCFPFIFRGALDCGASTINEAMKLACVKAIAGLARREPASEVAKVYANEQLRFGPEYLIPKPFDPRLIVDVPVAIVSAAMESGVATRPIKDMKAYADKLRRSIVRSALFMQPIIEMAQREPERMVYADGENEDLLHAIQAAVDEKIVQPILVGREELIQQKIDRLGLRLKAGVDFELVNSALPGRHEEFASHYHALAGREGVSLDTAKTTVHGNNTVIAALMLAKGEADGLICGKVGRFHDHFKDIRRIIGPRTPNQHMSSLCILLLPDGPLFLSDAFLTLDPTREQIVETAKASISVVKRFGIKPRVALLSHSNFGTSDAPGALKMRKAAAELRESCPDIEVDGEMHARAAMLPSYRGGVFAHANLTGPANLLICPNLDAANILLGMLRSVSNAVLIGPFLSGLAKPAHVILPSVSSRGIFNMTALAAADVQSRRNAALKSI